MEKSPKQLNQEKKRKEKGECSAAADWTERKNIPNMYREWIVVVFRVVVVVQSAHFIT